MTTTVLAALALVLTACGTGERPSFADPEVVTADAGQASRNRARAASSDESGSASDVDSDSDSGSDSGASDTMADGQDASDPSPVPAPGSGPVDEPTEPSTVSAYPEITEDITEVSGGVRGLISPTGVLLGVTGQTSSGYVVETPCGGVTTLPWGQPLTGVQVVLDPGHGGSEAGADEVPGLTEASLNLALARRTATELTNRSISVALTRNGDYRIPISRRAALADRLQAAAFISIHHNSPASRPSPEPGTEVYVQTGSSESRRLGGLLYEEVVETLKSFDVEWTSRDDAGVLEVVNDEGEDAYGIARYPTSTSALIEMAYIANEKEAALLQTTDYLDAASVALADGIERFLITDDPGTGFVDQPRALNPSGVTGGSRGCIDPPLQ